MKNISNVLKGISGEFELGRVLWALLTLALIAYQGVAIWWNKQNFDPITFGAGAAAILAAGGFGIAAKDKGVANAVSTTSSTSIPEGE
jgi:hypothetical protein